MGGAAAQRVVVTRCCWREVKTLGLLRGVNDVPARACLLLL